MGGLNSHAGALVLRTFFCAAALSGYIYLTELCSSGVQAHTGPSGTRIGVLALKHEKFLDPALQLAVLAKNPSRCGSI